MNKYIQSFTSFLFLLFTTFLILYGVAGGDESKVGLIDKDELIQVKVNRVIIDPETNQPVVLLSDHLEERALLIWIGIYEANAIDSEMQGLKHRRPLTHDLLEKVIKKVNGKIKRIMITHFEEGIYYAQIVMEKGGKIIELDARPSDSIVMALKFNAPIFVSKSIFDEMAIYMGEKKEAEEQYGLTLQNLTPLLAKSFSSSSIKGVLVSNVRKGSRAEKDGIERGDIFLEVSGQPVGDVKAMRNVLEKVRSPVKARIMRRANIISITINPK
jgi:bifunctional DNase/RNase